MSRLHNAQGTLCSQPSAYHMSTACYARRQPRGAPSPRRGTPTAVRCARKRKAAKCNIFGQHATCNMQHAVGAYGAHSIRTRLTRYSTRCPPSSAASRGAAMLQPGTARGWAAWVCVCRRPAHGASSPVGRPLRAIQAGTLGLCPTDPGRAHVGARTDRLGSVARGRGRIGAGTGPSHPPHARRVVISSHLSLTCRISSHLRLIYRILSHRSLGCGWMA